MSIYVVSHKSGTVTAAYERSPRVALVTDAASEETVPAAIRLAADSVLTRNVDPLRNGKIPAGADGVLVWLEGERLVQGDVASIRKDLRTPGRRAFAALHLTCLEEMDLIAIQPRWFAAGRPQDYWSFNIRIAGSTRASLQTLGALKANDQPWAQLSLSLLAEQEKPGAGIETLVHVWEGSKQLPSMLAALVLRNLVVLMVRHNELAKAEQFLELGMKAYPGYAELPYLTALLCFRQNRASRAVPYLERAKAMDRGFLGSGGESAYRADWLLGLLATRVGNLQVAFGHFLHGMISRPVFAPAVEELLKLRLPPDLVERHQWEFFRLARREPQFLDKVFDYLLLHRAFPAARRLVETMPLAEDTRALLRERLESATSPFRPARSSDTGRPGIILSGPFFEHSSLGRINREMGASLLESPRLDACLEPSAPSTLPPQMMAGGDRLMPGLFRHPAHLDLTIRHQWPPDFRRPPRGKLAVILPWEYGAAPRIWIEQIEQNVDELWVPSGFVRDVFVRCGVNSDRVRVIPNGVDPRVFTPEGPTSRPQGCRKFMFLFVGGAIRRKGVDALLEAYREAFDPGDDVTLVFNVSGSTGAYQHNRLNQHLQEIACDPMSPHVQVLMDSFDDATLARLYRGCDAFVLPYRGEGFGMPLLEAMACGKPVITTAVGPSRDFCSEKTAYLVSAREVEVPDEPPPLGELVGRFTWFEPDVGELARTLRHICEQPAEAAQRGRAASRVAWQRFSWAHITRLYRDRIRQLVSRSEAGEVLIPCLERA